MTTYGDLVAINLWIAAGGSLPYALSHAIANGSVLDLSSFFHSPDSALTPLAGVIGTEAAQAQGGFQAAEIGDGDSGAAAVSCGSVQVLDFLRGDANDDSAVDISDPIFINNWLQGGTSPHCLDAADADDSGTSTSGDATFIFNFLFLGTAAPPPPYPACGPDLTSDGLTCSASLCPQTDCDDDSLTDNYEAQRGTDPNDKDTDNDYFTDGSEVLPTGVPGCNGGFTNIRVLGADPLKWDIFVEIDYMVLTGPGAHSHLPMTSALEAVVARFGAHSINLHLDTGVAPFNLGGGNALSHQHVLFLPKFDDPPGFPTLQADVKPFHFDNNNSCNVFHYCVWAHQSAPDGMDEQQTGVGEVFGDDFIVSLGRGENQVGSYLQQAGTFMHELGHNLSLRHGGFSNTLYKPNYRSVMNYRFQLVGVDTDCGGPDPCRVSGDGVIDYSGEILDTLVETELYEQVGICNGVDIDWNCDGTFQQLSIKADINLNGSDKDTLTGFNDWARLRLFKNPGQGSGGGTSPSVSCMRLNDPQP